MPVKKPSFCAWDTYFCVCHRKELPCSLVPFPKGQGSQQ
uniref:Uncharacterized protein n=1 Tax=Arundo donax TaxID=35708 RepID=A0A0A9BR21_ARUDO